MSLEVAATSAQDANISTGLLTAYPFSLVCWYKIVSSTPNFDCPISIGKGSGGGTDATYFMMIDTAGKVNANCRINTTETGTAVSTVGSTDNNWHHAAIVYNSATDRRAYFDGGNKGTNTSSADPGPANINLLMIGNKLNASGTVGNSVRNMRVMGAALYNIALADADVAALFQSAAKGSSPLKVQTAALKHAPDFIAGAYDPVTATSFTLASATIATDNMSLQLPRRRVGGLIVPGNRSMRLAA